ncbi:hypothetical protein NC652_013030 [Populus alba x Populus x berolinensis]|uniref:Uncharacterized protein n=1 Tax=Populus alba x Populus x berolinensis TaxID=444605 RepID=A0AAD6QTD5_9ROSI|nr:hypothetical protein NC652_013030 [Populus alba x Populus x berolinensis]KAJ6996261.1 hypothetical protein NC653_012999 [Populus alba x Populus x berolinensis]
MEQNTDLGHAPSVALQNQTVPRTVIGAAKEFESELKKEPDSTSDTPGEQPTTISEEKKHDIEVSSSKESV